MIFQECWLIESSRSYFLPHMNFCSLHSCNSKLKVNSAITMRRNSVFCMHFLEMLAWPTSKHADAARRTSRHTDAEWQQLLSIKWHLHQSLESCSWLRWHYWRSTTGAATILCTDPLHQAMYNLFYQIGQSENAVCPSRSDCCLQQPMDDLDSLLPCESPFNCIACSLWSACPRCRNHIGYPIPIRTYTQR
jgi:hypothetical protein